MASVSPGSAQATPSGAAIGGDRTLLLDDAMRLDEAELRIERQAVGGGDEPPLPGLAVHQPLHHRAGEAAAAPVAGDDDHAESAGRPERRRHGGADQPVAVEGGDPAAEAEDQRPVLRPVRPALGAGERDSTVEMGGRQRVEDRGLGHLGHRAPPNLGHSGGGRRAGAVPRGPRRATSRRSARELAAGNAACPARRPGEGGAKEATARNKLPRRAGHTAFSAWRRPACGRPLVGNALKSAWTPDNLGGLQGA